MSAKAKEDKANPDWPWTARQRRQKISNRQTRKKDRHKRKS